MWCHMRVIVAVPFIVTSTVDRPFRFQLISTAPQIYAFYFINANLLQFLEQCICGINCTYSIATNNGAVLVGFREPFAGTRTRG